MTTLDDTLDRLDEPERLPQEIVQWQPGRGPLASLHAPSVLGGVVAGAVVLGAVALTALAIGRIGGRGRLRTLEVDRLIVGDLRLLDR